VNDVLRDLSSEFYPYAQQRLGFNKPANIEYLDDPQNAQDPLGKTAYYDPTSFTVSLYTSGRHPKDILRSLSHELVHHAQNCRGEFEGGLVASEGYAQEDDHLRSMEKEAYEQGNLVFRDWEDKRKSNKDEGAIMEHFDIRRVKLNKQLMDKFGYKVPEEPKPEDSETTKTKEKKK